MLKISLSQEILNAKEHISFGRVFTYIWAFEIDGGEAY
jgi:hypothetical protein